MHLLLEPERHFGEDLLEMASLKLRSRPVLVAVLILVFGCGTQGEPTPVLEEETGIGTSITEPTATVTPVLPALVSSPTAPPNPSPTPISTSSGVLVPTPAEVTPTTTNLVEAIVTNVVDGDTIDVQIDGQEYRVRYIGVDTPETVHPTRGEEPYGVEASDYNKTLVMGQTVFLEKDVSETDRYGRLLRYVWLDNETMVNSLLVAGGMPRFPPSLQT
jgi:endonuclease YncB( thermonuclease family)